MSELPGPVFARRLRAERRRVGLSQTALAAYLTNRLQHRVDPSAVTRIENGERAVRLDEAVFMAEAIGVPLPALLVDSADLDDRIAELRRKIEQQQARQQAASAEVAEADLSIAALHRQIEKIEASRRVVTESSSALPPAQA